MNAPLAPSTRAKLLAVAALVQEILENDEQAQAEAAAQPIASADPATCEHPEANRIPAPVMGKDKRFVCTSCRSVVEE